MAGATFALYAVYRDPRVFCLQPLLQCRFEIAQSRTGAYLLGQLLGGLAQHLAPRKGSNRFQPAVEKQRTDHCFHGIRKYSAFAPEATFILAPGQPQMPSQPNRFGNLRHMQPAYKLSSYAGQFALMPIRMQSEKGLSNYQPQHGVAEKLKALIIAGIGIRRVVGVVDSVLMTMFVGCLFLGKGSVRQGAHEQFGNHKSMSQCGLKICQRCFQLRLVSLAVPSRLPGEMRPRDSDSGYFCLVSLDAISRTCLLTH